MERSTQGTGQPKHRKGTGGEQGDRRLARDGDYQERGPARIMKEGATVSAVLSSESLGSRHRHPSWIRLVVVCWSDERQFGALADSSDSSSASGANR